MGLEDRTISIPIEKSLAEEIIRIAKEQARDNNELDKAIEHETEMSKERYLNDGTHERYANWLKELKHRREQDTLTETITYWLPIFEEDIDRGCKKTFHGRWKCDQCECEIVVPHGYPTDEMNAYDYCPSCGSPKSIKLEDKMEIKDTR